MFFLYTVGKNKIMVKLKTGLMGVAYTCLCRFGMKAFVLSQVIIGLARTNGKKIIRCEARKDCKNG